MSVTNYDNWWHQVSNLTLMSVANYDNWWHQGSNLTLMSAQTKFCRVYYKKLWAQVNWYWWYRHDNTIYMFLSWAGQGRHAILQGRQQTRAEMSSSCLVLSGWYKCHHLAWTWQQGWYKMPTYRIMSYRNMR